MPCYAKVYGFPFIYQRMESLPEAGLAAAFQLLLPGMPMIFYGDEYGIDGGPDPDCRRGMVWDEEYQDKKMFAWYQKLISLRHTYPCLTEGKITAYHTDDEAGTIAMTIALDQKELTILFHCKKGTVPMPEYTGKRNLISEEPFAGFLGPLRRRCYPDGMRGRIFLRNDENNKNA